MFLSTQKVLTYRKRYSQVLSSLTKQKAQFIFLQETHFRSNSIPKISNHIYQTAFHSTNPIAKTKGVSILVSKQAPFQLSDSLLDPEGRFVFIKGTYASKPITLANIYAPNEHQVSFFRKIGDLLTSFKEGIVLLGGDFNVPLNPNLDTSSGTSMLSYRALRQIKLELQGLALHDTWRTMFPSMKDYTFYSIPFQKYSRLDYLFLSQPDLTYLTQATIDPMFLSDHHPISVTLTFPDLTPKTKTWRLNSSLLKDTEFTSRLTASIDTYFRENSTPDISPTTLWEAHKCVIRGELMAQAAKVKRLQQATIDNLIANIRRLEATHKQSHSQQTLQELMHSRSVLLEELGKCTRRQYVLHQRIFYEQGNKCGRLLARAVRTSRPSNTIYHIQTQQDTSLFKNEDIAHEFEQYYKNLYNLRTPNSNPEQASRRTEAIKSFLNQYGPQPISQTQAEELEQPLSTKELQTAIRQMKPGKSPGPDGFTLQYYKCFAQSLAPKMLSTFNSLADPPMNMGRMLEAHITVIPKEGKDKTRVQNYRPISLLNVDIKIYAKILANRMSTFLPSLISLDQVGFVPGREARDNTIRALNIHHWLTTTKI